MDTWLSRAIEQEAPTSKSMIYDNRKYAKRTFYYISGGSMSPTICQPKEEMARAAVKMVLDLIEDRPVKHNQKIFTGELLVGESTRRI